ncbi:uncharacterized protein LOC112688115 isoform X2 [Sipha flava]|jgi:hypothetical protein|uniref:Uncharacterized protein LOC112688115 isoform X2 n=2 Tax=Sipha flava TaxID=143950 RepID=A0A8B8G2Q4_9HEMI|nr:uncharacterized protein LOC112688115 isoform X2 [Sipha flava]XP_025416933.1 uncharacterized protein LOC112688115 isoform X2 [Sipha flava]XP_025416935.1 uncharacterized protein LOC112688115 isoform X2 [Sipha flava]XP_025416936.1 uncharacterized protein LOC112688115 isoform X2 [Sipha flava]XP_025416937.1 uncharacterized protein LOC112688115 isoform X2 [Sipha flava]
MLSSRKRCGQTDHVRASSAKCPQRELSRKRRLTSVTTNKNVSTYTVQEGFRKFCPDSALRERIAADVFEVSALAVEVSVHVHYRYTKPSHSEDCGNAFTENSTFAQNHLLDFFTITCRANVNVWNRVPLDAEYFALRGAHESRKTYGGKLRSHLIQPVAVRHETAMKNCVCVHLYDRVVRYVNLRYEGRTLKWVWKCRLYEELFSREHRVVRSSKLLVCRRIIGISRTRRKLVAAGSVFA